MKLASLVCISVFAGAALVAGAALGGCTSREVPEDPETDSGFVGLDAGWRDSGPPDAGRPDTGPPDAGQDAGRDAGMCVATCATDEDCARSCPGLGSGTSCCDRVTFTCYAYGGFVCPVAPVDAGVTMPY